MVRPASDCKKARLGLHGGGWKKRGRRKARRDLGLSGDLLEPFGKWAWVLGGQEREENGLSDWAPGGAEEGANQISP